MKATRTIGLLCGLLLAILPAQMSFATADNRSTFQQWTFTSSPGQPGTDGLYGPFEPNSYNNPFGPTSPKLYVGNRATWGNNAWALRNDEMDIYIPNYPDNSPETSKTMTVELTWLEGGLSILPDVPVIATSPTLYQITQDNPTGNVWKTTTYTITLKPNPIEEWLFIKGDIVVKEVSVTTQCIPEPASIGLLIGGALLAFKRSRNRYGKKQITETAGDMNF